MDGLKLIDDYARWYKDNTAVKNLDTYTEITTPFVNHINDRIRLYVEVLENDKIRLSDDGNTINELELYGLDLDVETRKKMSSSILRQFGLKLLDDVIYLDTDLDNFAKSKHKLLEGIIRFYDLTNTKRSNVIKLFTEEVQHYFYEHDFGGTPNVKLTGLSGIDYQVDYIIGETKTKPERLVQTVNHLTFDRFTTFDYIFKDLSPMRLTKAEPQKIIIVNDENYPPQLKAIKGARNENIQVIAWSDKEQIQAIK